MSKLFNKTIKPLVTEINSVIRIELRYLNIICEDIDEALKNEDSEYLEKSLKNFEKIFDSLEKYKAIINSVSEDVILF